MVSLSMKTIFTFALLAVATQPANAEVQKGGWSRWGWGWGWGLGGYWNRWPSWNYWSNPWWKKRILRADA